MIEFEELWNVLGDGFLSRLGVDRFVMYGSLL